MKYFFLLFFPAFLAAQQPAWHKCSGIEHDSVFSFAISGNALYAGTNEGVFRSDDNGGAWAPRNKQLDGNAVRAFVVTGDSLFAGTNKGVYLTTDGGATWTGRSNALANKDVRALLSNGRNMYIGTANGVFRTTDRGKAWYERADGSKNNIIMALASGGEFIYAKTYGQNVTRVMRLYDNGPFWEYTNLPEDAHACSTPECGGGLVARGDTIIVATESGIYRTSDNGITWTKQNEGLPGPVVHALVIDGTNIYAGTDAGVYRASVAGGAWSPLTNGLTTPVYSLIVKGNSLFAGTPGNGVFKLQLTNN